jgi:hypothetical protein
VQFAHRRFGLLLVRQVEIDPLRRLDIADRDRAANAEDAATMPAGHNAQDDLVRLPGFRVGRDIRISQALRPADRAMRRLRSIDEDAIALVDFADVYK